MVGLLERRTDTLNQAPKSGVRPTGGETAGTWRSAVALPHADASCLSIAAGVRCFVADSAATAQQAADSTAVNAPTILRPESTLSCLQLFPKAATEFTPRAS